MDLQTETDELEVVVVKSWYSYHAKHRDGWEMNIEWEDLDGKTHNRNSWMWVTVIQYWWMQRHIPEGTFREKETLPWL